VECARQKKPGVYHDGSHFTQNKLYGEEARMLAQAYGRALNMVYQSVFFSASTQRVR
jgi:hypothetical protein